MAKLKTREQRLLFAFIATLFLAASWYLWKFYKSQRDHASEVAFQLSLQEAEFDELLEERDKWTRRSEWLDAFQPNYSSRAEVDNELLEEARAIGVDGVTTKGFTLLPPIETIDYVQAGVTFTAQGELPHVFEWLHTLQRPETFRVIRGLKVIPNKEEPTLVDCEIELLKWYRPGQPPEA